MNKRQIQSVCALGGSEAASQTPAPPRGKRRRLNPLVDRSPVSIPYQEFLDNLATTAAMRVERQQKRKASTMGLNFASLGQATRPTQTGITPTPPLSSRPEPSGTARPHSHHHTAGSSDVSQQGFEISRPLRVTEIEPYDHNPRLFANERADDLRLSLLANGFNGLLTVTKRTPDSPTYMLAAGSNTTLLLLQELYASSGDERFLWVNCLYQPFETEGRLLAQHLGENLARSDMKFWEIAKGMCELMQLIDTERRAKDPQLKPLTVREMATELMTRGLKVDKSSISNWRFASEHLDALGCWTVQLNNLHIRLLQPALNLLRDLAKRFDIAEDFFWQNIVSPCLKAYADTFPSAGPGVAHFSGDGEHAGPKLDAQLVCDQVELAFARHVGEPRATITQMLQLLKANGRITLAELRMPSPNLIAVAATSASKRSPASRYAEHSARLQAPTAGAHTGPAKVAADPTSSVTSRPTIEAHPVPSGFTQRPLNLLTGLPSTPHPALLTTPASTPPRATTGTASAGSVRPSIGPLFEALDHPANLGQNEGVLTRETSDPLLRLHEALQELLAVAQLQNAVRWKSDMPLGFYVELPDPGSRAFPDKSAHAPASPLRQIQTAVWWQLAAISGQLCIGAECHLDEHSRVFRYQTDQIASPMDGTDIEATGYYGDELTLYRISPGAPSAAMRALRQVEEFACQVYEALPERWRLMQRFAASEASQGTQYTSQLFADDGHPPVKPPAAAF